MKRWWGGVPELKHKQNSLALLSQPARSMYNLSSASRPPPSYETPQKSQSIRDSLFSLTFDDKDAGPSMMLLEATKDDEAMKLLPSALFSMSPTGPDLTLASSTHSDNMSLTEHQIASVQQKPCGNHPDQWFAYLNALPAALRKEAYEEAIRCIDTQSYRNHEKCVLIWLAFIRILQLIHDPTG